MGVHGAVSINFEVKTNRIIKSKYDMIRQVFTKGHQTYAIILDFV